MGSATYTSLEDLKTLIEEKWNTGADDAGYPPRVVNIYDEKTIGYGDSRNPIILLQPDTEDIEYFNLYGTNHLHSVTITLDIRTYLSLEDHEKKVNEAHRTMMANRENRAEEREEGEANKDESNNKSDKDVGLEIAKIRAGILPEIKSE